MEHTQLHNTRNDQKIHCFIEPVVNEIPSRLSEGT